MARYNRIFAALDGSDAQEAVVRRTLSIAHDNNAEVLFGHVIDSSSFETGGIGDDDLVATRKASLEKELERFLKRAQMDECIPSVEIQVKIGRIIETIEEDIIKPFDPDLVICGIRGFSNIKYAFVGSVSTQIIRNTKCDVLVVRPESIEEIPLEEYAPYNLA